MCHYGMGVLLMMMMMMLLLLCSAEQVVRADDLDSGNMKEAAVSPFIQLGLLERRVAASTSREERSRLELQIRRIQGQMHDKEEFTQQLARDALLRRQRREMLASSLERQVRDITSHRRAVPPIVSAVLGVEASGSVPRSLRKAKRLGEKLRSSFAAGMVGVPSRREVLEGYRGGASRRDTQDAVVSSTSSVLSVELAALSRLKDAVAARYAK